MYRVRLLATGGGLATADRLMTHAVQDTASTTGCATSRSPRRQPASQRNGQTRCKHPPDHRRHTAAQPAPSAACGAMQRLCTPEPHSCPHLRSLSGRCARPHARTRRQNQPLLLLLLLSCSLGAGTGQASPSVHRASTFSPRTPCGAAGTQHSVRGVTAGGLCGWVDGDGGDAAASTGCNRYVFSHRHSSASGDSSQNCSRGSLAASCVRVRVVCATGRRVPSVVSRGGVGHGTGHMCAASAARARLGSSDELECDCGETPSVVPRCRHPRPPAAQAHTKPAAGTHVDLLVGDGC
jgi:hypothetical protein